MPHANGFSKMNGRPDRPAHEHRDGRDSRQGVTVLPLENGGSDRHQQPKRSDARGPQRSSSTDRRPQQPERQGSAKSRPQVKVVTVPLPIEKPSQRPQPTQQPAAVATPFAQQPKARAEEDRPGSAAIVLHQGQAIIPARPAASDQQPVGTPPAGGQTAAVPIPAQADRRVGPPAQQPLQPAQRPTSAEVSTAAPVAALQPATSSQSSGVQAHPNTSQRPQASHVQQQQQQMVQSKARQRPQPTSTAAPQMPLGAGGAQGSVHAIPAQPKAPEAAAPASATPPAQALYHQSFQTHSCLCQPAANQKLCLHAWTE